MTEEELKEQPTQEDVHEEPNRQHVQPGEPEGSLEQDGLTERQPREAPPPYEELQATEEVIESQK